MPSKSKHWVHFFMYAICIMASSYLYAQDSLTISSGHNFAYPDDLDSTKVDSFYLLRTIDLHQSNNPDLYFEIFRWYKTCYRYGGNTSKGIDCSHFVNMLYEKLYGKTLGPSVGAIIEQCHIIKKGLKEAQEGDLVFFKIKKGAPSHTGIYLQNGMFAHASTHSGVIISSMEEPYYKKRFYKIGRVK